MTDKKSTTELQGGTHREEELHRIQDRLNREALERTNKEEPTKDGRESVLKETLSETIEEWLKRLNGDS